MWNYIDSNKIVGTEMKVNMHKLHLDNLAKTRSTIKGLVPWRPKHSLSKIHNKYTVMRQQETNKENNSLLNRMLDLEAKPLNNYTNIIPETVPTNPRTYKLHRDHERNLQQVTLQLENRRILKRIESAYSLYGRHKWQPEWKSNLNYRNNIIRKESVPDFAELARSRRSSRPMTAAPNYNEE